MANQVDTGLKILVAESNIGFGQQQILSISSGARLYTAYVNDANQIEVRYSDNGGASWTFDTGFSETSPYHVSMCRSELNDIFVCYVSNVISPYIFKVKKKDHTTGSWSEIANVSLTTTATYKPSAMVTYNRATNRLHLFWLNTSNGTSAIMSNQYSDDYGSTWSSVTNYSGGQNNIEVGLLGLDTDPLTGKVLVLSPGFYNSGNSYINRFSPTGVFDVNYSTGNMGTVNGGSMSIDASGVIWYALLGNSGGNYYIRLYSQTTQSSYTQVANQTAAYKTFLNGNITLGLDGATNWYMFYTANPAYSPNYPQLLYFTNRIGSGTVATALTTTDGVRPSCEQRSIPSLTKVNYTFVSNV
jgi:hypothetical protein